MRRIFFTALIVMLVSATALAQSPIRSEHIVLVVPFENLSKSPGIEWIGEAFSEVLGNRMSAAQLFVVRREDRVYAFDRLGIPVNLRPSRATLYKLAEQMDVDYVVLGDYTFDGRSFTARAQVMDMKRLRLSPESVETGALTQLVDIQNALAWDLLRSIDPTLVIAKNAYVSSSAPLRLDSLEDYIRGMLATDPSLRIKYFKDATRLTPDFFPAIFQLGKTYFDEKEYEGAAQWFSKVPRTADIASEASFYAGMSYYYTGNFDKAEDAFMFVARHVPLIEVYNNLGVVESRRGKKEALQYFARVVQADSRDPDYRFNYAVALSRTGDTASAVRQLKEALAVKPQDFESKALLDSLNNSPGHTPAKLPLERIKSNYDETSYRQLAMEIQNATEEQHAALSPAQHAALHSTRGADLMQEGLFDQAENEFREAILLDQANRDAHSGLARVLEENDQLADARAEAVAANRIKFAPETFLTLARIDIKQKKLESARDNIERALRMDPENADGIELNKIVAQQLVQKPKPAQNEQP